MTATVAAFYLFSLSCMVAAILKFGARKHRDAFILACWCVALALVGDLVRLLTQG